MFGSSLIHRKKLLELTLYFLEPFHAYFDLQQNVIFIFIIFIITIVIVIIIIFIIIIIILKTFSS